MNREPRVSHLPGDPSARDINLAYRGLQRAIQRAGQFATTGYVDAAAAAALAAAIAAAQAALAAALAAHVPNAHAPTHMDPALDPIEYLNLPGAAYRYLQDYINNTGSAGRFTHEGYTDHGDGSITINAGDGMIKTADNNLAPTPFCGWQARTFTNIEIVNNSMNHIYVRLVAGVPTLEVTQVEANINGHSEFEIYHLYRRGNALRIGLHGPNLDDTIHHVSDRAHAVGHIRTDGLEVTEVVVRHIQMALGHLWAELTELEIPAIDTNPAGAANTFFLWHHVAAVMTPFPGTAQVPNANYDNGVNPVALTPNRYGVYWVWVGEDGTMDIVMGRGNYTLSQAQGSTAPQDLPPEVLNMGTFIARIIIQQGGGAFLEVAYPWDKPLGYTSAIDHNTGLINHQGGIPAERYHMTAAQHAIATQDAQAAQAGYVTAAGQSFGGLKQFVAGARMEVNSSVGGLALPNEADLVLRVAGVLAMAETTTPTAATNFGKVYCKNDNKAYFQDGAGVEHELGFAGAGITGNDYICLQDQKAQNTAGGAFTFGARRTRDLNVEQSDDGAHCTLAANQFTLDAGDYVILAFTPAYRVDKHQAYLHNVTGAVDLVVGMSNLCVATDNVENISLIMDKFTVAAGQALEIQHECQTTKAVNGFGDAANFDTEVYTNVQLWKVA